MKTAEDIVGDYIINEDNSQSEVGFMQDQLTRE